MLNFIIGYLVIVNCISMIFMYIDMKTDLIKLEKRIINFIYALLAIIGGSIGILVTSQMFGYKKEDRIIKRFIPFIVFLEVIIIGIIIIKKYELNIL